MATATTLTNMTRQELIHEVSGAIKGARTGLFQALQASAAVAGLDPQRTLKVYDISFDTGFDADALAGKTVLVVEIDEAIINTLDEKAIGPRISDGNLPT